LRERSLYSTSDIAETVAVSALATAIAPIRKAAATKKARYRQRLREGLICVEVEVSNEVLELLLNTGWLARRSASAGARVPALSFTKFPTPVACVGFRRVGSSGRG
jgi:hypothetical protein